MRTFWFALVLANIVSCYFFFVNDNMIGLFGSGIMMVFCSYHYAKEVKKIM